MKKIILLACALALHAHSLWAWQGRIEVSTPNTMMLLHADEGEDLRMAYYGPRLAQPWQVADAGTDFNFPVLPAFGTVDMIHPAALQVQHAGGDQNLELSVKEVNTHAEGNATTTVVTMTDRVYPFTVKLYFKAYNNCDMIETWTEMSHTERKPVTLLRYDSGHLTLRRGDVWATHLHGNWAAEATPTHEPLNPGMLVIQNSDGARNAHCDAPELMLSLDGKPQENTGRTIGMALCWSGNYQIRVNTANNVEHHVYAGISPEASHYVLEPNTNFATPHLALTYSSEGMGGVSRNFHRWARHEGMLHNGNATRDVLLNSWEGVYFDITQQRMTQMMDDIKQMGGELFVMDDGWFGTKYQRNNDSAALGDWQTDLSKLPGGLEALCDAARERGVKFGIWIEPEAVNTQSELYEKHPDWALQARGRELRKGRGGTQLVLDMTNPRVQDFVFDLVDRLLTQYPSIAYIKWDANASIQNYGSPYLAADRQSNLYVEYHRGLVKTLQRIRAKHPHVTIQDCASGGGRANYGLLPYFDEFWVSDNNDALQRVFIQWGTSYFFPSNAMGQHIGGSPYHMTGRQLPIKFRCDVAMSGRLGMELQPQNMTQEEREQVTTAIADYKEMRELVQLGNLYRLVSPYDNKGMASLMYVDDSKSRAVVFAYKMEHFMNQTLPRLTLAGLDPDATYTLHERNLEQGKPASSLHGKQFTGRMLMEAGVEVPLTTLFASRIYELIKN